MKVAFYKGTRKGVNGLYSRGVRFIEKGSYSHCELVFHEGDSASSSFEDGGVRFKDIKYTSGDWDFVDVSWADKQYARNYFEEHEDEKYDLKGNLHFLIGIFGDSRDRKFCSEAVAEALGIKEAWLLAPNALYNVLVFINEIKMKENMNTMNPEDPPADDTPPPDDTGGDTLPPKKPKG